VLSVLHYLLDCYLVYLSSTWRCDFCHLVFPLQSIGTLCGHLCKNGWTDRDAVWVMDSDGPKKLCVRWGSRSPWKGAILGARGTYCKVYGLSVVSCAKTAEPIDLALALWHRVGRRKHKFNRIRQVASMCPQGATWRIRLKCASAAEMSPGLVSNYSDHLFVYYGVVVVCCWCWLSIEHITEI